MNYYTHINSQCVVGTRKNLFYQPNICVINKYLNSLWISIRFYMNTPDENGRNADGAGIVIEESEFLQSK